MQQSAVEAMLTGVCGVMASAAGGTWSKVAIADVIEAYVIHKQ
jgi:hypothetical protein